MAAKKKINKTQFVKALPKDMSAKDVVRKAKESGIVISEAYVYTIRSAASRAAGTAGKASTPAASAKKSATPAAKVASSAAAKSVGRPAGRPVGRPVGRPKKNAHVVHAAPAAHVAAPSLAKTAKKAAKKSAKKTARHATHTNGAHQALATPATHASPSGSAERRFVELVADIGMRRAEIFLQQFRGQVGHIKVG